jgi:hypothetical protein
MKRTSFWLWTLVALLALVPVACKRAPKVRIQQTEEEGQRLVSTVRVSDPKLESQLVSGFYGVEGNAWRWTAKNFSVVLHAPMGAAQKGADLTVALTVPGVVVEKLKTVSLAATANGQPLTPETYTEQGQFTYKRSLPASAFSSDSVRVDFQLDKAIPPSGADQRELGIIVSSIGLDPK